MVRIKLLLAFLVIVFFVGSVLAVAYWWENDFKRRLEITKRVEQSRAEKPSERAAHSPDLGLRHFDDAMALLIEGELMSAREKLLYVMEYYPDSSRFEDAKRIVGDINLDMLLSKRPIPGKAEHIVKSGDFPLTIARKYNTTLDYIMQASGKTNTTIFKGEVLTVYPLDFSVEINLSKKTLTMSQDGKFFKEYKVLDTNLPYNLRPPVSTSVESRVAWDYDSGKPAGWGKKVYPTATKWIKTKQIGLFVREYTPRKPAEKSDDAAANEEFAEDDRPFGVMVSKIDLEEIYTLLRYGTPVKVVK